MEEKERKTFMSTGLTSEEVESCKKHGDINVNQLKSGKSYGRIIIDNVFTFFNILMISIAVVLILFCGWNVLTNLMFLVILIINTLTGTIQECHSKKTLEKLKLLNSAKITVIRNGQESEIYGNEIVLGDLIILKSGDQIPVDCKILTTDIVEVNESLLTGESVPVKKSVGETLFAGSYIVNGLAKCETTKVGDNTYIASLEKKAKDFKKPKSKLITSINGIIKILAIIAIPLAFLVLWHEIMLHGTLETSTWGDGGLIIQGLENVVFYAATVITYMIPAGMILLSSITMATGVVKLAKKKTLTQDLYSVESLSRVDTLCFDKTGTLTDGTMTLEKTIYLDKELEYKDNFIITSYLHAFKTNNQTSEALLNYYSGLPIHKASGVLEFSSERKYSAVTFEDSDDTYALGAPEYLTKDTEIIEKAQEYTKNGCRVLLFTKVDDVIRSRSTKLSATADRHPQLLFVIRDNIRPEVRDTLAWFRENDVDVKVISGDNINTVSYIAKACGIENWDKAVDLSTVSEADFERTILDNSIYGRVTPEQKAMIVDILKAHGRTVAMTGDGINDIIALKKADCSIALANGAPATKNIANLVLMDSNFNNLKEAVLEGRRIVNNIQRSSTLFVMKDFLWFFITILPNILCVNHIIQPTAMSLVNFLITGIGSFLIAFEPDKERIKGNFLKNILGKAITAGFFMFLPVLFIYIYIISRTYYEIGQFDIAAINTMVRDFMPLISICISIAGFIIFFNICFPFTKYRAILFSAIMGMAIIVLLALPEIVLIPGTEFMAEHITAPFKEGGIGLLISHFISISFTFNVYKEMGTDQLIILGIFTLVSAVLYILTDRLVMHFLNRTVFKPNRFEEEIIKKE